MSILKFINERRTDRKRLHDKIDYLTARSKTADGKLVGNSNCISRYTVEEMLLVKKIYHKTGGRCWVEIVVSLTPDEKFRPDAQYMEIAKEIVDLFEDFQCLYTVHLDSKVRHLHILMNTVSVRDGRKFSQSPAGLQRLKQQTNDILQAHGFDIIKIGAAEMLDLADHTNDDNFAYLEIDEPECIYQPDEIEVMTQGIQVHDTVPISLDYIISGHETQVWRDNCMNEVMQSGDYLPMQKSELAIDSGEVSGMPLLSNRPTISVDVAPHYTLNVSGNTMDDDMFQAVRELGQTTPEQLNAAANMAMALYGAAEAKGYGVNITVNAAPTIEINFDNSINPDVGPISIHDDPGNC